uniref:F-box domain-containing protein n=1 Tax=Timema genevievae TaxID=629358 RepID=A0A7R9JVR0_TIMGE|nr:unnamed protein product [Timema genevievae]
MGTKLANAPVVLSQTTEDEEIKVRISVGIAVSATGVGIGGSSYVRPIREGSLHSSKSNPGQKLASTSATPPELHKRKCGDTSVMGHLFMMTPMTTQSTLPYELILKIFLCLSIEDLLRAQRVCHRWQQVFQDDPLWKNLEILIDTLVKYCPELRSLKFHDSQRMRPLHVSAIRKNFVHLRNVHICVDDIVTEDVDSLNIRKLSSFHNLNSISLMCSMWPKDRSCFQPIAEGCHALKHFSVGYISSLSSRSVANKILPQIVPIRPTMRVKLTAIALQSIKMRGKYVDNDAVEGPHSGEDERVVHGGKCDGPNSDQQVLGAFREDSGHVEDRNQSWERCNYHKQPPGAVGNPGEFPSPRLRDDEPRQALNNKSCSVDELYPGPCSIVLNIYVPARESAETIADLQGPVEETDDEVKPERVRETPEEGTNRIHQHAAHEYFLSAVCVR